MESWSLRGSSRRMDMTFRRGIPVSYGQTPDLVGLPGVHVEVNRVERLNVPEAMVQAERDADFFRDGAPTVFHRRTRSPWLVTMRLEDWLKLYESSHTVRSSGFPMSRHSRSNSS